MMLKYTLLLCAIFPLKLACMNALDKNNQFRLKDLLNDLIPCIAMRLDCSSIRNLKLVCTTYNTLCNMDAILEKSSYTVSCLMQDFDLCDNAFVYYAVRKNKKIFELLWNSQSTVDKKRRLETVSDMRKSHKNIAIKECMRAYRGDCESVQDKVKNKLQCRNVTLSSCVKWGRQDSLKMLLTKGASPDMLYNDNETLLYLALRKGYLGIVELLIAYGANVNKKNRNGCVPLHLAAEQGNMHIIKLLCDKGAAVNVKSSYSLVTPLHNACKKGRLNAVRYLLFRGADGNAQDDYQETPLYKACEKGRLSVVKELLYRGADHTIGYSPRSGAYLSNKYHVIQLLDEYGVSPCIEEKVDYILNRLLWGCADFTLTIGFTAIGLFLSNRLNGVASDESAPLLFY